ncbi:MAG: hypothetical protein K2X82_18575 [Gemmataceae bacterium]|nr:hypothetical protein [Gemmataceae bacterium]
MRTPSGLAIGLALAAALTAADDPPSADERKALDAYAKTKGAEAAVDDALRPGSRVAVRLDAADDAALKAVAKLPGVGAVEVRDATKCTERGFAALKDLKHLRRLILNTSGVSDAEAARLAGCKELRELVIPSATVTARGVADLAKLTRLEKLDLSDNPKLPDAALAPLGKLERLEFLYLAKTGVTDKGLDHLKPLEGLRTLDLRRTAVTEDAARAFADAMPNLRAVKR